MQAYEGTEGISAMCAERVNDRMMSELCSFEPLEVDDDSEDDDYAPMGATGRRGASVCVSCRARACVLRCAAWRMCRRVWVTPSKAHRR